MLGKNYFIDLAIVLFLFFFVFGLAEFLWRKGVTSFLTRKVVHIGGSLVATLLPFFVDLQTVVVLGVGFSLLLLFSKKKNFLGSIHKIEEESVGALLFAPSLTVTALIFWPVNTFIFQGATLVLGLSDGVAGLIGRRYGKHPYRITNHKTIEGSVSFFLITLFILFGALLINGTVSTYNVLIVFGYSLLLTVLEAICGKGWDNLFLPLAAGTFLYFIL